MQEKVLQLARVVPVTHDATSAGSHMLENAEWERVRVSSVVELATLLENVFKQVQVEDMGHRQASISPDRLLQQGCLHSLQKITVLVEYNAANIVTGTIPLFSSVA
jgi:hypothetical protein